MRKVYKSGFCAYPQVRADYIKLQRIAIGEVSTYRIWCEYHDRPIFNPIDESFNLQDISHLDLQAYRTIGREFQIIKTALKVAYSYYYTR